MEIITREQAKELNLKRYFTGSTCFHGHLSERFVSSKGCVDCGKTRHQIWNKNYGRNYRLKKYDLNKEQFNELLERQNYRCAICEGDDPKGKEWCVDHDHIHGYVRGLLCYTCNVGIGLFKDDPFIVEQALAYLKKRVVW